MTSGPGFNPLSQPNFMPIALPPGQSTPPQQPNPASGPATSPPPNPTETAMALSLAATGFKFAEGPTGQTQDQWIDAMRTSANPMARAQFDALTMLAGGRGDNVAIKQVLDRYYALFSAKTASDVAAADKGMINQIATALGGLDPINKLMDVAQPAIANMVRGTGIGQTEWGASLQKILDTPGTISSYRTGFNEGVMEGGKALVVDIATMAAKTAQYAADHSVAGAGGDAIRSLFGTLPAGLDAITPSLARGLQTDKAIIDTGQKIGAYLANRTPAQVGADVAGVISKQWDSLKASHAEAVRQGPQAEARWWGNVTGRITFEVAGTFVPVAGQAGKANTLAKGGGMIADGARTVDKLSDGARVIDKAVDGARAGQKFDGGLSTGGKLVNDLPHRNTPSTGERLVDLTSNIPIGSDNGISRRQVILDGGKKGAWPKELNARHLQPNTDYIVNGYKFVTDGQGRVVSVEGKLDLVVAERNGYQQRVSGREERLPDDQGGHLIASIFNGPGDRLNLVPMNGNFNMGKWRSLEDKLAKALENGQTVEVKIDVVYAEKGGRPEGFSVEYSIDGVTKTRNFENKPGG